MCHEPDCGSSRNVDVYMEAIRCDNVAKLYDQCSREG
jgi:hypothetical protein